MQYYVVDASGNVLAQADGEYYQIKRYYIYGQGLVAMITDSDDLYTYHFNATGSTMAITDASQKIVNKYTYDCFGAIGNQLETIKQPFKFVGQHGVMAEPNGLYYMRNRYYDPSLGRFLQPDPLGIGGGDVNLYVYVSNNPILFIDPWGLCTRSFTSTVKTIGSGIWQAGEGAWNALRSEDLQRGVEFGVKAAGVVTGEVAKIVAQDVVLSVVKVPLTPAGSFAFGKSVGLIRLPVDVVAAGDNTRNLSNRIQGIQRSVFDMR